MKLFIFLSLFVASTSFSQVPEGDLSNYGVSCSLTFGEQGRATTVAGESKGWMQDGESFSHSYVPNYVVQVSQILKDYRGISFPAWKVSVLGGQSYWVVTEVIIAEKDYGSFSITVPVDIEGDYMDNYGPLDKLILSCISEIMAG